MIYIIILVALFVIAPIIMYNSFVKLNTKIDEAYATMDVCMKKRHDLIPNLVETVKGYAKHESETLEKVIEARSKVINAGSMEESMANEKELFSALKSVFALSESYPELKASQNFLDLQRQLYEAEVDIAKSRKYYNAVVKSYNTSIAVFPNVLIAKMFSFTKKPMYEISEAERENIEVKF